jgi:hypothetical protein
MPHDRDPGGDEDVVRLLTALPRTASIDPREVDRLVEQLTREGLLHSLRSITRWIVRAAAAMLIFALGAAAGVRYATQHASVQSVPQSGLASNTSREAVSVEVRPLIWF